ncbi:MAG: AAA family ATPase [Halomonas sp.]|uniref:AAA family ATPase n=1 Tax=Halomonas sp. TaxID=1486246 RepID=UPI001A0B9691|nr:bifunctional aminoglycoside phosphotransferase/ATP-binding protein [Halomonas sp.]MBE0488970.1 AAA family ATPase [Halomonas sp.]
MPHSSAAARDDNESLESLVDSLVAYHRLPQVAVKDVDPTRPLVQMAQEELAAIREGLLDEEECLRLDQLGEWLKQDLVRLKPLLEGRRERLVTSWALVHPDSRLCHEGRTLLVNAIGRDPAAPGSELPADPASDLAALLVGLEARGESALTRLALDRYLRLSGDYPQSRLLSLFGTCHALSGARRALQRRPAPGQDPEHPARLAESMAECRHYLSLAERIAEFRFPPLVIAVGVSGSGKSRFTSGLVSRLGAIRVCSDAERRRLHELPQDKAYPQAQAEPPAVGIFGEVATERTYRHLASCAGTLLDAGIPACVDATCLKRWQRDLLRQQAEARGLPCLMVSFEADEATLRRRIEKRARRQGFEVANSLVLLDHQLAEREPFGDEERLNLVHLDTTAHNAAETLVDLIEEHVKLG